MLELLQNQDVADLVTYTLAVVGAASALAGALRPLVATLKKLAAKTAWEADDAVAEALSVAVGYFASGLEAVHKVFSLVGLNPKTRDVEGSK